ncbi:BTAD domain-containing putative transcriptional regulator [Cryptosporangium sp. NPDC048952]|uniref:AfsR/SARP family transcriptional regulator n=1 Tax=Cryptosporangium sp. NPDC048952 TaxID=3363961 RepID=UPI00371092FF
MTSSRPSGTALRLLNAFDLRHDEQPVRVCGSAQRLLAFLALNRRPAHRRTLAATLWPDLNDKTAATRLRSTLWRLPAPTGDRLVDSEGGQVRLTSVLEVDLHLVEDDATAERIDITQLVGEILPDWDEPWVDAERERFRQLRLHRLEESADRALQRGQWHVALQAALAACATEPLRESAHRRVMQVHLAEGNPGEALRHYHTVRRLLRDELGLPPAPATREVVAHLLGRPVDARTSA